MAEPGSNSFPKYVAIIEDPDGRTYEQPYDDFDDLIYLRKFLGDDYRIVGLY